MFCLLITFYSLFVSNETLYLYIEYSLLISSFLNNRPNISLIDHSKKELANYLCSSLNVCILNKDVCEDTGDIIEFSQDMKKILENMDQAAAGEKPAAGKGNVNDMKTILESIQAVEECGPMVDEGPMPTMPTSMPPKDDGSPVSMNVSINARGKDHVAENLPVLYRVTGTAFAPVTSALDQLKKRKIVGKNKQLICFFTIHFHK